MGGGLNHIQTQLDILQAKAFQICIDYSGLSGDFFYFRRQLPGLPLSDHANLQIASS
jgi:hypothetical protein